MGDIADRMINGEDCSQCGVYLEPGEAVYVPDGNGHIKSAHKMPADGSGMGYPVLCEDCMEDY